MTNLKAALTAVPFVLLLCGSTVNAAETKAKFCTGEKLEKCNGVQHFGCPQDTGKGADAIASEICVIKTPGGGKTSLPFMWTVESNVGGEKCGYTVYALTCILPQQ